MEESLALLMHGQHQLTTLINSMQRRMGEMSLRLSSVEGAATQFVGLPYSAPQALPYGMPGYGGIPALPASGPVISEIMPTPSLPASAAIAAGSSSSQPAADSSIGSTPQPPSTGLPIQSIPFPHSPSPLPTFSSFMGTAVTTSSTVLHQERAHRSQSLPHLDDHNDGYGVPKFHKLSFPLYDGKEDPWAGSTGVNPFSVASSPGRSTKFGWPRST